MLKRDEMTVESQPKSKIQSLVDTGVVCLPWKSRLKIGDPIPGFKRKSRWIKVNQAPEPKVGQMTSNWLKPINGQSKWIKVNKALRHYHPLSRFRISVFGLLSDFDFR